MKDKDRMHDNSRSHGEDRGRPGEGATAAERAARRQREAKRVPPPSRSTTRTRPGATGAAHPPTPTPRDVRSRKGSAEPGGDDEGPVNRSGR
ncbi:hypothetical protein [Streptomyces sp. NPDC001153]